MSVITYRLQREKVDKTHYVKEIDLMSDEYIGETSFDGMLIYQSNHMPPQSLDAINEKFVRSYYRKYANQYEGVSKNPIQLSISKIADDKHNVYTGVLNLSDNF